MKRTVDELARQSPASIDLQAPFNTGTLVGPGTGLTVSGSIDGYECNLNLDTGSDISRYIAGPEGGNVASDPLFQTGQKVPMKGRCNLTMRIGNIEVSQPMWVTDIQDP